VERLRSHDNIHCILVSELPMRDILAHIAVFQLQGAFPIDCVYSLHSSPRNSDSKTAQSVSNIVHEWLQDQLKAGSEISLTHVSFVGGPESRIREANQFSSRRYRKAVFRLNCKYIEQLLKDLDDGQPVL
jgi:hypothetical protein